MKKLSFVIPCYGSEKTIAEVIDEIVASVEEKKDLDYEIITVNDCSPDNVISVLIEVAKKNAKVKVIDLAINSGKHSAMMAGYRVATGDVIVNLDDDGQCPMDKLWELIKPLEEGYDAVYAKYPRKKQSAFKNFGSNVNDLMSQYIINKPRGLYMGNFFVFKRFVMDEIIKYQNPYPYNAGLVLRTTRKIINVEMEERERTEGEGNFTFKKSMQLFLNGFTAFSVKPLRIATVLGFLCSIIGVICGFIVVIRKLLHPEMLLGYSSTMAVMLFIGGMIMLLLGMVGEYVGRIYICLNNSPQYVIRNTVNLDSVDKK